MLRTSLPVSDRDSDIRQKPSRPNQVSLESQPLDLDGAAAALELEIHSAGKNPLARPAPDIYLLPIDARRRPKEKLEDAAS